MALWSMKFAIFIYMYVCLDINPMLVCQLRDILWQLVLKIYILIYIYTCVTVSLMTVFDFRYIFRYILFVVDLNDCRLSFLWMFM